jgi:class 3 adenylate cyclase/mannose-6-phosphate isomerase-like protein (cupin superfamily)
MPGLEVKSFRNPDETRLFEKGRADIVTIGEVSIGRTTAEPGWKWSEHIRPLAGTVSCQIHHLLFVVKGRMRIVLDDGTTTEIGPDDLCDVPAGHDAWIVGDEGSVIFDYAGGVGTFAKPAIDSADRVLTTLLFTDIVGSTAIAERLGDAAWRELLARHNRMVRLELDRYRGREVSTTGDGFLATFDSAARAVRCAASISQAVRRLELALRAGVHTGEVEYVAGNVRGVSVHAAARIAQLAEPGEVLVSGTTRELLSGSGLTFTDRGTHELKGLSGPRQVYALAEDVPAEVA